MAQGRKERESSSSSSGEQVLHLVAALAAELREIDAERTRVRTGLGQAITRAHDHGYSWVDIARAAEFQRGTIAQQWALPLPDSEAPAGDGSPVSAGEAAKRLGVARETVYAWVKAGRLESVTDPSGRLRVILPPEAS